MELICRCRAEASSGFSAQTAPAKTTLVRILATILRPDEGYARVLGLDVVREAGALRPYIGLAGQYAAVDEALTARENLRLIGQLSHRSASLILSRVDGLIERFGLTGNDQRPVRTFSGGMRRRLDLAAALVHRPPVLFLDEPTIGLDPSGRAELWAVIRELVSDGTTVLLTTQYLEEADRLSDTVVVIDHGQIIAQGTPPRVSGFWGSAAALCGLMSERGGGSTSCTCVRCRTSRVRSVAEAMVGRRRAR